MRNMSKLGKRLCSMLLILVMVAVMLPVSLLAEEGEETETQVTSEAESEPESEISVESESETSEQTESEPSESTEETQSEESESQAQAGTGSISGTIWLDENQDGVYDSGESSVAGYEVSLYVSSNTNDAVDTATTDSSGNYTFTDLAPNHYVAGIPLSQSVSGTEYLVPKIGINGDNKFALDKTTYNAYTNAITITTDTEAKNYSAGVRLPAEMNTLSVGIQDEGSTAYTVNSTTIGFAGKEWWVIGTNGGGVASPQSNSVTLFSKNADFGQTHFRLNTNTNYVTRLQEYLNSDLYNVMNSAASAINSNDSREYNNIITTTVPGEAGYDYYGWYGPTPDAPNQKLWTISTQEWSTINNATVRAYNSTGYYSGYWTRTPSGTGSGWGFYASANGTTLKECYLGSLTSSSGYYYGYARPALYLDLSSVLFTSDASGSSAKSAAPLGNPAMQAYTAPSGTLKLTRLDTTNLSFSSSTTAVGSLPGGTATFNYSGVKTGTNKSVSVMILNTSGTILYYGRPVNLSSTSSTSGTASFTVPGLAAGTYNLMVFNEEVNGDFYTDYASSPVYIPLVVYSTTPTTATSSATNVTTTGATLNGTHNTGGLSGTVYFQYGTTASFGSNSTQTTLTSSNTTAISVPVTGLTANTTYYYRTVVYVSGLYFYGNTLSFTTVPSITSLSGTPTGTTTADISAVFQAGLNSVYPTAVNLAYNDTNSATGAATVNVGSGSAYASGFSNYGLTNLSPNTNYYLWASETTAGGTTTYPNAATSTVSVLTYPDFTTWDIIGSTNSAAVSGSYYTGGSITAATVIYGTDPALSSGSETTLSGDKNTITTGDFAYTDNGFTCDISGLTMGTTYYVKTTVTNASGTTTSTIKSFLAAYVVTEKYVDEANNPIAADTTHTFVSTPYNYSFSGLTTSITTGGYYRYKGYKFDSYSVGDTLTGTSPSTPADVLTGNRTVYLVYENLDNMINVTVPGSFYWYADETTETSTPGEYVIKSGNYSIINNSADLNLKVELDSYGYTSGGSAFSTVSTSNITLNMTGDLNESPIGSDLLNGASSTGTYTNILYGTSHMTGGSASPGDKGTWTFGFDGNYTGSLPSSGEVADYTATLTFSVASTTP